MIESFSDLIASAVIILLLMAAIGVIGRLFLTHRQQRLIEEEIEYYQDW